MIAEDLQAAIEAYRRGFFMDEAVWCGIKLFVVLVWHFNAHCSSALALIVFVRRAYSSTGGLLVKVSHARNSSDDNCALTELFGT